jgi:RNA polymerase sigma-70 factor (ECF subfamily)
MNAATVRMPKNLKSKKITRQSLEDPEVGLMLRVKEGDEGAFAELVARYRGRVLGSFVRRLGDRQLAEDLTQDVFLRLFRSRQRYQPRARFTTWLYHITRNVARNAFRSRRRHSSVCLGGFDSRTADVSLNRLTDHRAEPSSPVERSELASAVRAAVSELMDRQRTALELHQFQDFTYAQIAAELDVTPEAAKSLLYRARNQLRTHLSAFFQSQQD